MQQKVLFLDSQQGGGSRLPSTVLLLAPLTGDHPAPAPAHHTLRQTAPGAIFSPRPPFTSLLDLFVPSVSPGAGVPQQLQAIQVHPNTSNSDSSPETSHTSTNSTGRQMCCVKCSGETAVVKTATEERLSFQCITDTYWPFGVIPPHPRCDASFSSISQSPSNHRHLVSANICGGSHDVPQPPHSHVRLHASTG